VGIGYARVETAFIVQPHPTRTKRELKEQCFRAMANRSLLMFQGHGNHPTKWPANPGQGGGILPAFNHVQPFMKHRHLLPNRQGVEWTGEEGRVLFAYTAFDYPPPFPNGVAPGPAGREFPRERPAEIVTDRLNPERQKPLHGRSRTPCGNV